MTSYDQLSFDSRGKKKNTVGGVGEWRQSAQQTDDKAGFPPAEDEIRSTSPPFTKIPSKWIKGLHLKPETP